MVTSEQRVLDFLRRFRARLRREKFLHGALVGGTWSLLATATLLWVARKEGVDLGWERLLVVGASGFLLGGLVAWIFCRVDLRLAALAADLRGRTDDCLTSFVECREAVRGSELPVTGRERPGAAAVLGPLARHASAHAENLGPDLLSGRLGQAPPRWGGRACLAGLILLLVLGTSADPAPAVTGRERPRSGDRDVVKAVGKILLDAATQAAAQDLPPETALSARELSAQMQAGKLSREEAKRQLADLLRKSGNAGVPPAQNGGKDGPVRAEQWEQTLSWAVAILATEPEPGNAGIPPTGSSGKVRGSSAAERAAPSVALAPWNAGVPPTGTSAQDGRAPRTPETLIPPHKPIEPAYALRREAKIPPEYRGVVEAYFSVEE